MAEEEMTVSFFVMSGDALRSLNDELQIQLGEKEAGELLERYGYRCGESLVQSVGYTCDNIEELEDTLPGLLIETGLGRAVTKKITADENAVYEQKHTIDVSTFVPMVSRPGKPHDSVNIEEKRLEGLKKYWAAKKEKKLKEEEKKNVRGQHKEK